MGLSINILLPFRHFQFMIERLIDYKRELGHEIPHARGI